MIALLGKRLADRRVNKNLSQAELARRVGVGRDSYNKYERAGVNPSNDTLVLLAKELDCSVDYLLGQTDNPAQQHEKSPPTNDGDGLTAQELEYLKMYRAATPELQAAALAMLEAAEKARLARGSSAAGR